MLKQPVFNIQLKLHINFNEEFQEQIFRSSRMQMFFKISVLKNFAIRRIKKRLQHSYSSHNRSS